MIRFFLFSITLLIVQQVGANDTPDLGLCRAIPVSKKYIDADFESPPPKRIEFKCDYRCTGPNGTEIVSGFSTIQILKNSQPVKTLVCHGVVVEEIFQNKYDFKEAENFFPYATRISALRTWAFNNKIPMDQKHSLHLRKKLKADLLEASVQYGRAGKSGEYGAASFEYAGKVLFEMAGELPEKAELIDIWLGKRYSQSVPINLENELIFNILYSQAYWRLPLVESSADSFRF
ncbi:MAG: hypothetical protein AB8E15_04060 [Bdellovibrionales bacterium]